MRISDWSSDVCSSDLDPGDRDVVDAALREAEEEIGLHRRDVTIAGTTDPYRSGSGYHITPVLGVIPPDLPLDPNPDEVEEWFEVPLDHLLNPDNSTPHQAHWPGRLRRYYAMHCQDRRIWGVADTGREWVWKRGGQDG